MERGVLHQDISQGNIMYMDPSEYTNSGSTLNAAQPEANLTFAKYLLGER